MEPLVVICPQVEENSRLSAVLAHALEGRPHMKLQRPDQLHPMEGRRVLFAISLLHGGVNLGWYAMLSAIRQDKRFFEGCCGAVLVDGDGELYTKSAAREIVFAANQAGCAFMGAPLIEATGSLENFHIRAMLRHTDYLTAYTSCAGELVERLLADTPPVRQHPNLMVLHASNRKTSKHHRIVGADGAPASGPGGRPSSEPGGTAPWPTATAASSAPACTSVRRDGASTAASSWTRYIPPSATPTACCGCAPNYNDALAANLTACINRLTALFRTTPFYNKDLYAIIVSGYSGGDIVAQQLISALCMNKAFRLPPRFCMLETANDAGAAVKLPGHRREIGGVCG